ncbi:methyltransferase domain-containing protein, partial [bacterium]
ETLLNLYNDFVKGERDISLNGYLGLLGEFKESLPDNAGNGNSKSWAALINFADREINKISARIARNGFVKEHLKASSAVEQINLITDYTLEIKGKKFVFRHKEENFAERNTKIDFYVFEKNPAGDILAGYLIMRRWMNIYADTLSIGGHDYPTGIDDTKFALIWQFPFFVEEEYRGRYYLGTLLMALAVRHIKELDGVKYFKYTHPTNEVRSILSKIFEEDKNKDRTYPDMSWIGFLAQERTAEIIAKVEEAGNASSAIVRNFSVFDTHDQIVRWIEKLMNKGALPRPFNLFTFDEHPDNWPYGGRIGINNWVSYLVARKFAVNPWWITPFKPNYYPNNHFEDRVIDKDELHKLPIVEPLVVSIEFDYYSSIDERNNAPEIRKRTQDIVQNLTGRNIDALAFIKAAENKKRGISAYAPKAQQDLILKIQAKEFGFPLVSSSPVDNESLDLSGLPEYVFRFYEAVARKGWGNQIKHSISSMPDFITFLSEQIGQKRILSIGIGRAELESALAVNNDVTCIDVVPAMVQAATDKGLNSIVMDAHNLKFATASFDVVIFPYSISHMRDVRRTLLEARRVLKDTGKLLLISQRPGNVSGSEQVKYGCTLRSLENIVGLVKTSGFKVNYATDLVILPSKIGKKFTSLPVNYIFASRIIVPNADCMSSGSSPISINTYIKGLTYSLRLQAEDLMLYLWLHKFAYKSVKEVVKYYDFITIAHIRNVVELVHIVKDVFKLGYIETELLELAGWLHDVGKSVKVEKGKIVTNYEYLSVLLTPQKLEYSDPHLQKLMKEHAYHSEIVLEDGMGYRLPLKLEFLIRYHHPFAITEKGHRHFFAADPDFKVLSAKRKKEVLRLAHIFMVIDAISAYTEASRPTNWFDDIAINESLISGMIKKRYGRNFAIDVDDLVRKILASQSGRTILENNRKHNSFVISRTIREWNKSKSLYDVPFDEVLSCRIRSLKADSQLLGFKNFLFALTTDDFKREWAESVFVKIIWSTQENEFIRAESRRHLEFIAYNYPQSLFGEVINKYFNGEYSKPIKFCTSSPVSNEYSVREIEDKIREGSLKTLNGFLVIRIPDRICQEGRFTYLCIKLGILFGWEKATWIVRALSNSSIVRDGSIEGAKFALSLIKTWLGTNNGKFAFQYKVKVRDNRKWMLFNNKASSPVKDWEEVRIFIRMVINGVYPYWGFSWQKMAGRFFHTDAERRGVWLMYDTLDRIAVKYGINPKGSGNKNFSKLTQIFFEELETFENGKTSSPINYSSQDPAARVVINGQSLIILGEYYNHSFEFSKFPPEAGDKKGIVLFSKYGNRYSHTTPDLMVYSLPVGDGWEQGIRGVLVDRKIQNEGLLRPLLNTFFTLYPAVRRTHPYTMNLVVLNVLVSEYGFAPEVDMEPNAWFKRMDREKEHLDVQRTPMTLIYFKDKPTEAIHMRVGCGMEVSQNFIITEEEFKKFGIENFKPVYLGVSLVLKDQAKFDSALSKLPVHIINKPDISSSPVEEEAFALSLIRLELMRDTLMRRATDPRTKSIISTVGLLPIEHYYSLAMADKNKIFVMIFFMQRVCNDMLAFVLSHEEGHIYYKHHLDLTEQQKSDVAQIMRVVYDVDEITPEMVEEFWSKYHEAMSDIYALKRLYGTEYDYTQSLKLMQNISFIYGEAKDRDLIIEDKPEDKIKLPLSHPTTEERARILSHNIKNTGKDIPVNNISFEQLVNFGIKFSLYS